MSTEPVSVQKPRRWTAEIPEWHPCRLNELLKLHWASAGRRKKRDYAVVALFMSGAAKAISQRSTKGTRRRVSLKLILRPRQRAGDADAYWKVLLDGLVRCGMLVDDSRTWCEVTPVEYERGTAKTWGTVITIEEVSNVEGS